MEIQAVFMMINLVCFHQSPVTALLSTYSTMHYHCCSQYYHKLLYSICKSYCANSKVTHRKSWFTQIIRTVINFFFLANNYIMVIIALTPKPNLQCNLCPHLQCHYYQQWVNDYVKRMAGIAGSVLN